jgi:hypothetical protein
MTDRDAFFSVLHKHGYRDLRAISTDKKIVHSFGAPIEQLTRVEEFIRLAGNEHLNVFVGVAERIHINGRQLRDCSELHALFVDLDFKAISEEEALATLASFPIPPDMIVATGGGLHCYWLLAVPINLTVDSQRAKQILRALATKLGGDLGAATPERILRVPGTLNYKYSPPRPVTMTQRPNGHTHQLDDILEILGPLPKVHAPKTSPPFSHKFTVEERIKKAKMWLESQASAVEGKGGDLFTYQICCAVAVGHDLSEDDALLALPEWNARCQPPWDADDLRTKLKNAIKYADGVRGEKLQAPAKRHLSLVPASHIQIRPVHWCWKDRLALGSFALLGGREGIGKSLLAYQLVADITMGRLPGQSFGTARSVIIAATEDSWEHTIVPRLMAAGADLNKVYRVDVETDGVQSSLSLPRDVAALEQNILDYDVALVLLDPLMSRLDAKLDSHKDAEVRIALEPLSRIADRTNCVVLGIIHVNKSSSTDPLTMLMGSRAFAAVARAVLFVMADPEVTKGRMMGQPKNNLGKIDDLPTLMFRIDDCNLGMTDEGEVHTGKLVWTGETERTVADEIEVSAEGVDRSAVTEASEWLFDFLTEKNGYAESGEVKAAAKRKRHSATTLQRARRYIHCESINKGTWPRITYWCLPGVQPIDDPGGSEPPPF